MGETIEKILRNFDSRKNLFFPPDDFGIYISLLQSVLNFRDKTLHLLILRLHGFTVLSIGNLSRPAIFILKILDDSVSRLIYVRRIQDLFADLLPAAKTWLLNYCFYSITYADTGLICDRNKLTQVTRNIFRISQLQSFICVNLLADNPTSNRLDFVTKIQ